MPIYKKIVRDLIPNIIEEGGKNLKTRILSEEKYINELKKKTFEELEEYMNATNNEEAVEELADVLELVSSGRNSWCYICKGRRGKAAKNS
ncbi:putative house-cleaning noncanonical NTP pyrophosphatase (MazG superfamily) [Peribacillus deserti]|uniref:House-cleaning noncanonical NTP pyrophosphatase (MazG superfamily) n=1 Tax=Peribacillus deserti TaxID=673318 RepID=A0ABS2QEQ2_9BACI|nr:putative house-cleaning noncanonical NTP pyrophosphatase (MazG superfamily) [Peribacillus deserti]